LSELQGAINDIQLTKDLTKRIELKQKNEIGEIADAFNIMLNGFQDIIQSVVISVFQLKQSAENLRIASNNVEVSSTKQSDAALSMAAESEQMLSGIESIASNAKQTHAIAVRSDELSSEGENAVNLAAEEMTKIAESVKISSVSINQLNEAANAEKCSQSI
jgi:methyl-accepting chemotaxis protein